MIDLCFRWARLHYTHSCAAWLISWSLVLSEGNYISWGCHEKDKSLLTMHSGQGSSVFIVVADIITAGVIQCIVKLL